jgi:hypothetical protein
MKICARSNNETFTARLVVHCERNEREEHYNILHRLFVIPTWQGPQARGPGFGDIILTVVPVSVTSIISHSPRAPFRKGKPERRSGVRSPRAELPIRTRAALGPRSTGKKTGLHGACLTQSLVRRTGKTPRSPCFEETRFWSRAIGVIAGGECRGEAPEGGRAAKQRAAALCAEMAVMRLSALRLPF